MSVAQIWVFNVEHGFQLFMRSPTSLTLAIDAGRCAGFSPARYVHDNQLTWAEQILGITRFVLSHPHADHLEDITSVATWLKPQQIHYRPYAEAALGGQRGNGEGLEGWHRLAKRYTVPVPEPLWGMGVTYWSLPPGLAEHISGTDSQYLNNTSIVVVLQLGQFKMVVPGDLEASGWEAMLRYPDFRAAVAGMTVLVASHHGHSSGYTPELFISAGFPVLTVISAHSNDDSVDPAYGHWSIGACQGQRLRKTLTTRSDGSLIFDVDQQGNWKFCPAHLAPNTVPRLLPVPS